MKTKWNQYRTLWNHTLTVAYFAGEHAPTHTQTHTHTCIQMANLSDQLPAVQKALRPCRFNHPSTRPSIHPSLERAWLITSSSVLLIMQETECDRHWSGVGVQRSITNVFNHYWLTDTQEYSFIPLSISFSLWRKILIFLDWSYQ